MWIKCSDQMPPDNEPVLVFPGAPMQMAVMYYDSGFHGGTWMDDDDEFLSRERVTHWMPLPAEPSATDEAGVANK